MLFSRNELKPILHQLSTNDPDLTALHLSHKKITNRQLLQISDALATNTNVTEIWLTNNFISDDAGEAADGGMNTNTGSAGSVGYLMNVLEMNRSVTEVYLGGNKIGAKGASSIANLLRVNSIITEIGLEDNCICDGSAKMLADALSTNTTLQTLKLHGNNIQTDHTLETINQRLKKNRDCAKSKFEKSHPELIVHTEINKKKSPSKKDDDKKKKRRSKDGSGSKSKPKAHRNDKASLANSKAFLEERKQSLEQDTKTTGLLGKLKGMGIGAGKNDSDGLKKGSRSAAFV